MSDNYKDHPKSIREKPFNLDDFSKMLYQSNITTKIIEDLLESNSWLDDYKPVPYTRWQRSKYRFEEFKHRCKDMWTIISGGDVHENCGD